MIKARVSRTAIFSLFFLVSAFAPVHAQAIASAAPAEAPSPLSAIATWLNHLGDTDAPSHRQIPSSTPLPRPRPAVASAPVASNEEWSEFVPSPGAFKKKTPTPVQIND
jgi:hypothetical protein